jgi:hypothetical protein
MAINIPKVGGCEPIRPAIATGSIEATITLRREP